MEWVVATKSESVADVSSDTLEPASFLERREAFFTVGFVPVASIPTALCDGKSNNVVGLTNARAVHSNHCAL